MTINYSCDGGETQQIIAPSIDAQSEHWLSYRWTVPAENSTNCKVLIKGYQGEVPTWSGVFAISGSSAAGGNDSPTGDSLISGNGSAVLVNSPSTSTQGATGPTTSEGCSAAPTTTPSAPALLWLLAAGMLLGRRPRRRWKN